MYCFKFDLLLPILLLILVVNEIAAFFLHVQDINICMFVVCVALYYVLNCTAMKTCAFVYCIYKDVPFFNFLCFSFFDFLRKGFSV